MSNPGEHTRYYRLVERPMMVLACLCGIAFLPIAMIGQRPRPLWILAFAMWALMGVCLRYLWRHFDARDRRRVQRA